MPRVSVSATVDEQLIARTRRARSDLDDAALLARHRAPTIDGRYVAYDDQPIDDPIPLRSAINLDSVESVGAGTLPERICRHGDVRMHGVCAALAVAVDCDP